MVEADGTIRTDDLAFAVTLACAGINPTMERIDAPRRKTFVVWVVPSSEVTDSVRNLADEYVAGKARVEPRRFMREARAVRNELYKFLDHSSVRVAPEA